MPRGNRGGARGRGVSSSQGEIHYTEEHNENEYYTDTYDPTEYETYAIYSLELEECHEESESVNESDIELAENELEDNQTVNSDETSDQIVNITAANSTQEVHSVRKTPGKKFFAHLQTSSDGKKFHHVPLQIDTAATCNTMFNIPTFNEQHYNKLYIYISFIYTFKGTN